jgi:hypothetical protein
MRNSLGDLNNHLFAALERLNDEDITGDKLNEEIQRARTIANVSRQIIDNGKLALDAMRFKDEKLDADKAIPAMLEGE